MKGINGLGRQVGLRMMAVGAAGALIATVGMYLFYLVLVQYWPSHMPPEDALLPSGSELAIMLFLMVIAAALAVKVAARLSRRILLPLTSVTEGLRHLAEGDLGARASSIDCPPSEVGRLVEDFNRMAERLEAMSKEQRFWNAAIAHELRTPLTILSGRLQGLTEGIFEPSQAQFRALLQQAEGLQRLVEDLRAVALADSGHLHIQPRPVRLADEIRSLVQLFEPGLRAAGLVPRLRLENRPMRCDPARMRQALSALLENARRHAVAGELLVQTQIEDGCNVLRVIDEGPGISRQLAGRIFDAFQRGERRPTGESTHSGSGLGLAVVRAIALAHGGTVRCRAAPTGGTVFELAWPVRGTPRRGAAPGGTPPPA